MHNPSIITIQPAITLDRMRHLEQTAQNDVSALDALLANTSTHAQPACRKQKRT